MMGPEKLYNLTPLLPLTGYLWILTPLTPLPVLAGLLLFPCGSEVTSLMTGFYEFQRVIGGGTFILTPIVFYLQRTQMPLKLLRPATG